ncbi:MAG: hypothetical protein QXX08_00095 [Candidatus Bathyarchaeia archaeon]
MQSAQKTKRLAKEELQRIIEFCKSVESKGLNPFLVEVNDLIAVIKEYFPQWEKPDELSLDAEALNQIATIIKMQSEWIKHRATSLYRDPFLIEEKLRSLSIEKIGEIFLEAWRPIVEFEQISIRGLSEALRYWNELPPLDERWRKTGFSLIETGATTREELIMQGILLNETFSAELEKLWDELKRVSAESGKVRYWNFIGAETYGETVKRAYLVSFLVTYGYATLEIRPLEEEIFIKPYKKTASKKETQSISFPISISFEAWKRWRENQEA